MLWLAAKQNKHRPEMPALERDHSLVVGFGLCNVDLALVVERLQLHLGIGKDLLARGTAVA